MEGLKGRVFCPYCSEPLELKKDQLFCKRSRCMFSPKLTREFLDAISSQITKNEDVKSMSRNYGHFFCIRCGTKMDKIGEMHERCMACGFEIGKSTYFQIIELNPHKGL